VVKGTLTLVSVVYVERVLVAGDEDKVRAEKEATPQHLSRESQQCPGKTVQVSSGRGKY
jgi:hypothetical protein